MSSTIFFFLFIPLLAFILLAINLIFAPHNPYQEKNSAFECGFSSFLGQNRTQFSISFFIFALLFLLFDLEILLVYPYLVSAYTNGIYGLTVLLIFLLALTLGFAFELGKKALSIDSRQISDTSKVISNKITGPIANKNMFFKFSKKSYSSYSKKSSLTFELFFDMYLAVRNLISTLKFILRPISITSMLYSRIFDYVYNFAIYLRTPIMILLIDLIIRYNRRNAKFLAKLLCKSLYKNLTFTFVYNHILPMLALYVYICVIFAANVLIENGFVLCLFIVPVIFSLLILMYLKGWLYDISAQNKDKKSYYKSLLSFAYTVCDIAIVLLLAVLAILLLCTIHSLTNFDFVRGGANNKESTGNNGNGGNGGDGNNGGGNNGGGGGPQEPSNPAWAGDNQDEDNDTSHISPYGQQRRRRDPNAPIQIYPQV